MTAAQQARLLSCSPAAGTAQQPALFPSVGDAWVGHRPAAPPGCHTGLMMDTRSSSAVFRGERGTR